MGKAKTVIDTVKKCYEFYEKHKDEIKGAYRLGKEGYNKAKDIYSNRKKKSK